MKGSAQQKDVARAPLLDAEEAHRLAVTRREKKSLARDEAKSAVEQLGKDRDSALRADDGARAKKITTALGEARETLELAEQAHALALEDERTAAAELARLTAEDAERRHRELVTAKLAEHAKLKELQDRACDEVARTVREMNRVEKELEGIGEKERASALHGVRPRHTFDVSRALAEAARLVRPVTEPSPAAPDA